MFKIRSVRWAIPILFAFVFITAPVVVHADLIDSLTATIQILKQIMLDLQNQIAAIPNKSLTAQVSNFSGTIYYISPTGVDTNNGTSQSTPWKTFAKAWSVLQPGNMLIVLNGAYTNASPPAEKSGTVGSPIIVQAQNDGGAVINQEVDFFGNSYISFIGFKVVDPMTAISVNSNGTGKVSHHLIFQKISFNCTSTAQNDGACFDMGDGAHDNLLEDSFGWGGARYTILCYGGPGGNPPNVTCDNNIFRRLVLRIGPAKSSGGNPQAALSLYYASNNIIENVLAVDGRAASGVSDAAFYLTGHAPPPNESGNKYYGDIALNNLGVGFYMDVDGGGSSNNTEIRNSVVWDASQEAISFYQNNRVCSGSLVDHATIGSSAIGFWVGCPVTSFKSNIAVSNGTFGVETGNGASVTTSNFNDFFGNTSGARSGVSAGANDKTVDPQLKYILRAEVGSPAKGAGEGGSDMGATVTTQYVNGVDSGVSLWPWPNEARIKADMCTGADATRGFCTKSSLTDYVWTYLGNVNPYAGSTPPPPPPPPPSDTTAPSTPTSLSATTISSSQINLSWTSSTDNVGVTGYKIYRGGVQIGTATTNSYSDTGLSASTNYSYSVSAYDVAGNNSTQSSSVSMTTQAGSAITSFTFGTAGDYGYNNGSVNSTLSGIANNALNFNLAIGDFSYGGTSEINWCNYVKSYVGANFPFELVSGNHDGGQEVSGEGLIDNFVQCLPDHIGAITGTYGREYYFNYPVNSPLARIIMISPSIVFTNGGDYDYSVGTSHYNWVVSAIDTARAAGIKWIIVNTHKNCMTVGEKATCEMGEDLMNLLISKKVDLILQGHDHTYQRSKQLAFNGSACTAILVDGYNANCVINNGSTNSYTKGAGPVIVVSGFAGQDLYTVNTSDPEAGYFVKWMGGNINPTSGFVKFIVSDTRLSSQVIRGSGGNFTDSFTITTGVTPPPPPPPSDTTAPSTPTVLSATSISSSQINLTWTASTDNVGITGYKIFRNGTQIGTANTNSYSDTGLSVSTAYSYTVSAYDTAGNNSSQSASASASTQTATIICTPPSIASGCQVTLTNATACTYNVVCPSTKFTSGQRVQTTSNLNVRSTPSSTGTLLGTQASGSLGTIVSGPTVASGLNWWNINFDSGVDGYSAEDFLVAYAAPISLSDTTAPSVPTNLSAISVSTFQINLSWTLSTDVTGVTGYKVFRNGTQIGTASTNSYSDTGLTAGTNYSYTVSAYDAAGNNSGQSGSVSVTTIVAQASDCSPTNIRCVGSGQEYSTIQAASNVTVAGDTVLVYDGNYAGFEVTRSGQLGNPIIYKTVGNNAVINSPITGASSKCNGDSGICIKGNGNLQGVQDVIFQGFVITNLYRCISSHDGSPLTNSSTEWPHKRITIRGITCSNSGLEGFYLSELNSSLIEGNTITGSGMSGQQRGHGMYLANAGSDNTIIRGNVISSTRTSDSAIIHFNGDLSVGGDGIISGLLIENNILSNGKQNGLNMDGVQDSIIRNNIIYGNANHGIIGYSIDAAQGPKNMKIINNTIGVPSSSSDYGITMRQDLGGHVFFNNILMNAGSGGSISVNNTNFTSNNNVVIDKFSRNDGASQINFASWKSFGQDSNSSLSTSQALFVNTGTNDYHLNNTSPALNVGVTSFSGVSAPTVDILGMVRPQGSGFDAGAYESSSGGVIPPPPPPPPPPSDTTAPSTPTSLSATTISSSQINLSWTSSTDNVGVTGYKIYRGGVQIGTATTNSYSDTGLSASTNYSYSVSAYDAVSNNSTQSSLVSATTQPVASTKFTVGQKIQTTANLNVRSTPSSTGILLGTQASGSLGTIVSGPTVASGLNWWNINFDSGVDGYSAEDFLVAYAAPIPTPTPNPAPVPTSVACLTSSTNFWQNTSFANQTGVFTVSYDDTPNANNMDGVTGLSRGGTTNYNNLAVITRFNDSGMIDAMDGRAAETLAVIASGGDYGAITAVPYTAGQKYHFRLVINPVTETYSVFVTPPNGTEIQIGSDNAFRVTGMTTTINNWSVFSDIATHTVCNFSISTISTPIPNPTPGTTITSYLHLWSHGPQVILLQTILAKDPSVYPEGMISGFFGWLTQKAVQRFQVKYNIVGPGQPGYGEVGPKTRAVLNSLL